MRKFTAFLFSFILLTSLITLRAESSDTFPTILFPPMDVIDGIHNSKAAIYSEEFRIALLDAGRFRLIEMRAEKAEDIPVRNRLLQYNENSGRKAKFFLISKISKTEDTLGFQIELYDLNGEIVLAKSIDSSKEKFREDLRTLAEEVSLRSSFSGEGAAIWIQTYIDTQQWERAYAAWLKQSEYSELENQSEDFIRQGEEIKFNLSAIKRLSAERLLAGGYYEQARSNAESALQLQPGDENNQRLIDRIENQYNENQEAVFTSQLEIIYELIENKEYSGAIALCNNLKKKGKQDPRLDAVYEEALKLKEERYAWEKARSLYRKGEYREARKHIETALSYDSLYQDYMILNKRIIQQEAVKNKTNFIVNDYKDRFAAIDFQTAIMLHRAPSHMVHFSLGERSLQGVLKNDEYETYSEDILIGSASYTYYFQNLPDYLIINHPALSLQPYLSGQVLLGQNYQGEYIDEAVSGFSEALLVLGEISTSAGTRFQFYSFNIGTGFSLGMGGFSLSNSRDYPSDTASNSSESDTSFTLTSSWDILFGWRPGDKIEILFRYSKGIYPFVSGDLLKDSSWEDLTLGIGFQMW